MKLFLLVSPTASCSIFMNCFLSSLHFILWVPCLYLWEFCTYGEILNLQTVLCGLSNYFCNQFQFFKYVYSCPVGAFIHSVSLPCFASWSFQNLWAPCFRNALYLHHTFMLATLQHLQKNGGQGEGCRCQVPCQEEGGSVAEATPLGSGASGLPRRGAPILCSYLKSPQNGSQQSPHARVGITWTSWDSCVGKQGADMILMKHKHESPIKILFRVRLYECLL